MFHSFLILTCLTVLIQKENLHWRFEPLLHHEVNLIAINKWLCPDTGYSAVSTYPSHPSYPGILVSSFGFFWPSSIDGQDLPLLRSLLWTWLSYSPPSPIYHEIKRRLPPPDSRFRAWELSFQHPLCAVSLLRF